MTLRHVRRMRRFILEAVTERLPVRLSVDFEPDFNRSGFFVRALVLPLANRLMRDEQIALSLANVDEC